MKLLRALSVARYFLSLGVKSGRQLTNKKLQKLLYYAQAWCLVLEKTPLYSEPIEAWIHGPVIPTVYQRYKKWGFGIIGDQPKKFSPSLDQYKHVLDEVWRVYGKYDADYLELLTHNEEPWISARDEKDIRQSSNSVISLDLMRNFYSALHKKTSSVDENE